MTAKSKPKEAPLTTTGTGSTSGTGSGSTSYTRITQDTPPAITRLRFKKLDKEYPTKSQKIRALAAMGYKTNMIAHTLLYYNVLSPRSAYQHVRNVLKTPLKRPQQQTKETSGNDDT